MGGYPNPAATGMYPPTQPPQWSNYNPASAPAGQPNTGPNQAAFFPHQMGQGVGGPRFPDRPGNYHSTDIELHKSSYQFNYQFCGLIYWL